jgi:hypothetical protein
LELSAVGVASIGCDAERSQAVNNNAVATASEITINTFLDMLSSSGTTWARNSE